jgi:hypothetical protein
MYRCEAVSVEGFVQQLANLVAKGYRYYIMAEIPARKDVAAVDAKLIHFYKLDLTKSARYRRKLAGRANVAYLRHGRTFVLICTEGLHRFHDENAHSLDIRREPIRFHGYSIGSGKGSDGRFHASVSIHADAFADLLALFKGLAVHRSAETLTREFQLIRFSPFARVRRQYLRLLREVNDIRRAAGFQPVPLSALKLRRIPVKVFAVGEFDASLKNACSEEFYEESE